MFWYHEVMHGAWIVVVIIPLLVALFCAIPVTHGHRRAIRQRAFEGRLRTKYVPFPVSSRRTASAARKTIRAAVNNPSISIWTRGDAKYREMVWACRGIEW